MAKHKSKKGCVDMSVAIMTMLKANVIAYAITAIFIILGTIILTYTNLGPNFEKGLVIIGIVLSAFLAGFDMAKIEAQNGYKWGAIGGISYCVIFLILTVVLNGLKTMNMVTFITLVVLSIIMSSIAGMISVNAQK